ncbi:MAG: DNA polymerase IV [Candidatus Caldarchaeum sp.]|nr:DNA polymerase IV [Candidatus Caldarchaeum sp.]
MARVVLFVDLDYFFAQVEEVNNPSLKTMPVVVCVFSGRTMDSGVVSSANYLARRYGVKAGMSIKLAKRLLPQESAVLPVRMSRYVEISRTVMDVLRSFGGVLRVESIDEAVMDVTRVVGGDFDAAYRLASDAKRRVFDETGLTCSVGVGPNWVVAKVAADVSKPNGLKMVRPEEVTDFLHPLAVKALPGVGSKTEKILSEMGIKTLGELDALNYEVLEKVFGTKKALFIHQVVKGVFDEAIVERPPPKQVSKIITLKRNTRDVDDVMQSLANVVSQAAAKLESNGYAASKLGLIVITSTIRTLTRQTEIRPGTGLDETLRILRRMVEEVFGDDENLYVRRVGVRFSGLQKLSGQTKLNVFTES